jgi:hypothetical protein
MYHYWFVESESDPANDPIGLWLNGGPGSSSLIGMMTENGPFMTNDDSLKEALPYGNHSVPKLFHRDYHWAKSASYIWLESPAGVGFSYCDYGIMNKTTGAKFPCTSNDTSTAADNHAVLKAFFKGFPEFAKNEFFITGESYAGIYIPMLAEQIMLDKENKINLKGLAVGNGCWGSAVGLCSFASDMDRVWQQFLYGHNAITPIAYKKIVAACGDPMDGPGSWSNCTDHTVDGVCINHLQPSDRYASDPCQWALNNVSADEFTGQGRTANYEVYNYYDTCYSTTDIRRRALETEKQQQQQQQRTHTGGGGGGGVTAEDRKAMIEHLRNGGEFGAAVHIGEKPLTSGGALNDYTCGGMGAMGKWLEQPEVIAALHVENDGTHRYPGACAYTARTAGDLRPLYKTLAQRYKLMIYSGGTSSRRTYLSSPPHCYDVPVSRAHAGASELELSSHTPMLFVAVVAS